MYMNKIILTKYMIVALNSHRRGFSTRNAHMAHIVNYIRIKMVYTDK